MDGPLKELAKLEKLTSDSPSGKRNAPCITDSLDSLLQSLREVKDRLRAGTATEETLSILSKTVEARKKEIDDRQKDVYNSLARYGKALDKRFSTPLPSYQPLFRSPEAKAALERTIALHFLRSGQFNTAETFIEESGVEIDPRMRDHFVDLHRIVLALKHQDIGPALEWTESHREFLQSRSSSLEFRAHLPPFYHTHGTEISPYADLADPSLHFDLEPIFATEYCASLGMSRQVPLRVVGDIGGGGALARIEKGRKVMRERKSEWSQADELPIEIPLHAENRYHSIFACPVSKEQSTEQNPPMRMSCGHVITKDSLQKLSKPGGRVKCPYCPVESQVPSALRVHF
ncbi:Protein RMD5 A [Grifola frondosa]|uniref:GID complex catalytic subunit 2 n=1 Tax=Grifola frondosa TaxID=5627 RepID=A0A1C7MFT8_GRIFR|nr:Protein RMD5 A [Grifola frondosa]